MQNQIPRQLVVSNDPAKLSPHQRPERVVMFNEAGEVVAPKTQAELNSHYAPLDGEAWWLSAISMGIQSGAPSLTVTSTYWRMWLLDASSSEVLTGSVTFPDWVDTVHADVFWTNAGAGAGDVRMRLTAIGATNGVDLTTSPALTEQTLTAPAQNVLKVSRFADVSVSGTTLFLPGRIASDGADTLANDCALLGVRFVVASIVPPS